MNRNEDMDSSSDLFQTNLKRWAELFPVDAAKIAKFAPINKQSKTEDSSLSDAVSWFSALNLTDINVLYVYGVGSGNAYSAAKEWLQNPSHFLVFLENDQEALYHLLHSLQGNELLHDKQVRLQLFDSIKDFEGTLRHLAELFSAYEFSVETLKPPTLTEMFLNSLKSRLSYWTNLFQNERLEYTNSARHYYENFYQNLLLLPDAYLAEGLFQKFTGVPAIICGAGPSLDKNLKLLECLGDRALIFAGGTAMNAVNSHGFNPHFGVGIDPHLEQETRIMMNTAFETPFLYRSRMNHHALELLQSPLIYVSGSGSVKTPEWFEKRLEINTAIVNEGYNVINFSTALACAMGCNPIIFVGVDLAYTDRKSYQSGVQGHALHHRKDFRTKGPHEELLVRNDIYGQPIHTLWKWINESIWYGKFAQSHPEVMFVNATEGGLGMAGVPNKSLQEVSYQLLTRRFNIQQLIHDEIQRNAVPKTVTLEKIHNLCDEMVASLVKCEKLYQKLSDEKGSRDGLQIEPAFQYILSDFEEFMYKSGALALQQICYDPHLTEAEKATKKNELQVGYYKEISQIAAAHEEMLKNLSKTPVKAKKQKAILQKPTGGIALYYGSGELYADLTYNNDLFDGLQRYFYKNGQLKTVVEYKLGKLNGTVSLYYANGKKKRELHFVMGQRHGIERMWDRPGTLLVEAEYREGKPIGMARRWYSNGQLAQEVSFDNDGKVEDSKYWTKEGELIPSEVAQKDDYFDAVTKGTEVLTHSLETVFAHLNAMAPLLSSDENLKKELAVLQSEMEHLNVVNSQLKFESGLHVENEQEPIWKTPATQKEMQKKLGEMTDKLKDDIDYMQDLIKGLQPPNPES